MDLYLKEWGGGQTGVPGENSRQPARKSVSYNYYEVKIHRPNRESNPRPLASVISSLGQNAPTVTH